MNVFNELTILHYQIISEMLISQGINIYHQSHEEEYKIVNTYVYK